MKALSAKNMAPLPKYVARQRVRIQRVTALAEYANYDPNDIATDAEAKEFECHCILHSGGHKPLSGQREFEIWSDWNDLN